MKTITKLLIIMILIQASMAGADTNFTPELQQFISGLMDKGVHNVGELDLKAYSAELEQIQWHVTDKPFVQPAVDSPGLTFGANGNLVPTGIPIPERDRPYRESARYIPGHVYLSPEVAYAKPSDARTQMLCHEAKGALGYNDNHSAQCSSLLLIDQYPSLAPSLGEAFFNSQSLKFQGGSSVGGGGDLDSITLKQKVLNHIMSKSKSVSSEFLSNYAGITFEPMDEPKNQQRVMIMYEFNRKKLFGKPRFRGVRQDRRYEELVTVLFPRQEWKKPSAQMKTRLIKFISYGVLSLFPTSKDQMEIYPHFKVCNGEPLMVPKERDFNADLVLRFRANMIANCRPRTGSRYNEVGFEVRPPRTLFE